MRLRVTGRDGTSIASFTLGLGSPAAPCCELFEQGPPGEWTQDLDAGAYSGFADAVGYLEGSFSFTITADATTAVVVPLTPGLKPSPSDRGFRVTRLGRPSDQVMTVLLAQGLAAGTEAEVGGLLIREVTSGETFLCFIERTSTPPQCGPPRLRVTNLDIGSVPGNIFVGGVHFVEGAVLVGTLVDLP